MVAQQVPGSDELCEFVTILRKDLDAYMALAGMALVLKFDFTRFIPNAFNGWNDGKRSNRDAEDLVFHGGGTVNASYVNGAMVVRTQVTASTLEDEWRLEFSRDEEKSHAKFKIYDRKNDRDVETSCSPKHIVSYFEKSELPWHISPAFFRSEVLHRFKADPEMYTLEERSISCRGAGGECADAAVAMDGQLFMGKHERGCRAAVVCGGGRVRWRIAGYAFAAVFAGAGCAAVLACAAVAAAAARGWTV